MDGVKVRQVTGICGETLKRVSWNVGKYLNRRAKVLVYDLSSGRSGHVNFDDLRGDITCKGKTLTRGACATKSFFISLEIFA